MRREFLSGDGCETTNFRQSALLCAKKIGKIRGNAWEPHQTFVVEIKRISPISQQPLVSGHMLTVTFLFI
jgi:hypothetical protein